MVKAARTRGLNIYGMHGYHLESRDTPPALALGSGALPEPAIEAGVVEIGQAVASTRSDGSTEVAQSILTAREMRANVPRHRRAFQV